MTRLRYAAGAFLAVAALYVSFRHVDHAAVRAAMHAASLQWTIAALVSTLATLVLVTVRWGVLLGLHARRHWTGLWSAVVIGQAVNIVFPLRFGEAARVASMTRWTGWPASRSAMALAVERLCDIAAFAAVVLLLATSGHLPDRFARPVPLMLLVMALAVGAAVAGVALMRRILQRSPGPSGPGAWLVRQATGAWEGWQLLMRGPRAAAILLLTAAILVCSASTNYLVFRAFDLPVPAVAALVLLAVLQVGTAVVSIPGNVGVFQYLTILALAPWGVDQSRALAASLVLHVVSLGPRVALGAIAAMAMRTRHGSIRAG